MRKLSHGCRMLVDVKGPDRLNPLMFSCPNCRVELRKATNKMGVWWACTRCDGRSSTIALLRRHVPTKVVNGLWQSAKSGRFAGTRECPACMAGMAAMPVPVTENATQVLDVCTRCQLVWFDSGEHQALPVKQQEISYMESLPQAAREKLALIECEERRRREEEREWGREVPDDPWKVLPAILGMPVEHDVTFFSREPWVTWALAISIAAVSLIAFCNLRNAIDLFGLIPSDVWRYGGLTLLTSFFIHGGILHLLGNLYFLLVFGDNAEACLGKRRFAFLVLVAVVVGHAFHVLCEPRSNLACIGASGGISGIIAFYAFMFPKARIGFLHHVGWLRMPAWGAFAFWLLFQGYAAARQIEGFGDVSALAHIGGAVTGLGFWWVTRERWNRLALNG